MFIAVVAYKRKAAYFTINTHKTGLNASTGNRYNQKFAPDFQPQIPVLATLVYCGVAPATPALFTPTFPESAGLLASKMKINYRGNLLYCQSHNFPLFRGRPVDATPYLLML